MCGIDLSLPCHFASTSHSRVSFQAMNPASNQYNQVNLVPSVLKADLAEDIASLVEDTTQPPRSTSEPVGFWEDGGEEWWRLLHIAENTNVPICSLLCDTYASQYGEPPGPELPMNPVGLVEGICRSYWDAEKQLHAQEAQDSQPN